MRFIYLISLLFLISCQGHTQSTTLAEPIQQKPSVKINEVEQYYKEHGSSNLASESIGTVSNGKLINGKLLPFSGKNFRYFDTLSYTSGRAFSNSKLITTLLNTYSILESEIPSRHFCVMECSNKDGGKLHPHRTHQNGLSVDLMSPLIKDGNPYYGLDSLGTSHYFLDFDNQGKYGKDTTISIDFNLIARHIVLLDQEARKSGLKISKVIFKIELKDKLFATTYGQQLKSSGIYFAKSLSPMINSLHDDHYHIDFEILK